MRKILMVAATVGGAALAGLSAQAAPSLFGAKANGVSGVVTPVKIDAKLYDYCAKVIEDMKRGKNASNSTQYSAMDCMEIFAMAEAGVTAAEPGQPGRGGDGGGLPGLPGGKGGAAGNAGGAEGTAAAMPIDEELLDYCGEVLKQSRSGAAKQPESEDFEPSDCVDYFASIAPKGKHGAATGGRGRDGADGPSIAGGQGGKGGKSGSGSGGGSGGAGGAGVSGTGGKGGAGGSTD